MGQWGAENFVGNRVVGLDFGNVNGLTNAIQALPVKAKMAMYAAATARSIMRSTWDGCAFNQAGLRFGDDVQSTGAAAALFGCSSAVVSRFIQAWDSLTADSDEEATGILREKLEEVGLFTEPGSKVRIVSYSVWKDEQRVLVEDFQRELEATDFNFPFIEEAACLLGYAEAKS